MRWILVFLCVLGLRAQTINGVPANVQVPETSVTGLPADLASKQANLGYTPENVANKGQINGYASLNGLGQIPASYLPNPSGTTLGGIQSITAAAHQWISYIDTSGVSHQTQPSASDVAFTQTGSHAVATTEGARSNDTVNFRTDYGGDPTGATNDTTLLANAISDVITSGKKTLYIPAGTYQITATTGTLFNLTSAATGLCIYGDGPGVTILQYASNVTLTGTLTIFQINGISQCIHDLSIFNGSGMSGSFNWTAVAINNGSLNPHVYNLEISGIYGSGTSGGTGISTYQPFSQSLISTTMGNTYSSGAQTVTPGNMAFIYKGQRLLIGGTSEAVIVTAITATTFTATFANSHISSDPITNDSQGYQAAVINNNYIHDSYQATGIVLNSSSNVVRDNRIINIGSASTQHAIYDQGGTNRVEHNYVEGVYGAGIEGNKQVPQEDASGAVYEANTIINYGGACIILNAIMSDGVNPEVPSTSSYLNRYASVIGNNCRERNSAFSSGVTGGIIIQAPAVVSNNMLEDACSNTSSCIWVSLTSGGSTTGTCIATHNILNVLNTSSSANQNAIALSEPYCQSDHNSIIGWNQGTGAVYLNASNTTSHGDAVNGSTSVANRCVKLNANNVEVAELHCQADSIGVFAAQSITGVYIHHSYFNMAASTTVAMDLTSMTGVVSDIQVQTGRINYPATGAATTLVVQRIDGVIMWGGVNADIGTLVSQMGRLLPFPASTNTLTGGLGVKLSSGLLVNNSTSDTNFLGWTPTTKSATSGNVYIVGQVGAEVDGWTTDGTWTAGDYGILSTTTGGEIHDAGTTQPSSGSYAVFLNSGSGSGSANVLILKTY